MAIFHLSTSIEGLLGQNNKLLGDLFDMDGKDARAELLELKSKGHKYVPSDNCTNFDPFEKGCCCGEEKEKEIKGIVRFPEQKKLN